MEGVKITDSIESIESIEPSEPTENQTNGEPLTDQALVKMALNGLVLNSTRDRRSLCTGQPMHQDQNLLFVLKGETFAVRRAGERFNRLAQAQAGKRHVVGVELAESQLPGFP